MPPRSSDGATTTAARVRRPTGVCANSARRVCVRKQCVECFHDRGPPGDGRRSIKKRLCWCKMRVQYGACTRTRMMIKTLCVGLVYPSIFNNASLLKRTHKASRRETRRD